MRFIFVIILIHSLCLSATGQVQSDGKVVLNIDSTRENAKYWNNWLNNLYEMGVNNINDSLKINEEVIRLIKDSAYRRSVYPQSYSIQGMVELMQKNELKNAFWYMINIYQQGDSLSKNIILRTILTYESLLEMDKILVSTFYTYSFVDPAVTDFINGKPEITRPDVLENKFNKLKEMLNYIYAYRNTKKNSVASKDSLQNGR